MNPSIRSLAARNLKMKRAVTLTLQHGDISFTFCEEVSFSQNEKGITLNFSENLSWGNKYTITIDYHCFPRKGIYFIGWNDKQNISLVLLQLLYK